MRVLVFSVALVLGAVITWLLTVRRAEDPRAADAGVVPEPSDGDGAQTLDAEAFGGERTPVTDTEGAGGRWSVDAEDEDALLRPPQGPRGGSGEARDGSAEPPRAGPD